MIDVDNAHFQNQVEMGPIEKVSIQGRRAKSAANSRSQENYSVLRRVNTAMDIERKPR